MTGQISPFYGSLEIQQLQAAQDAQVAELANVAGAVVHARVFSSDDPEALGWSRLREIMADQGRITLRGVDSATIERAKEELSGFAPSLHFWDLFMADARTIRDVCGPIVAQGIPEPLARVPDDLLTPEKIREVQVFLTDQGVSPFSTNALRGDLFPAKLAVLEHGDGRIGAAGFAAMTHNRHSVFADAAWVGLIAVDPDLRGLGLGKTIDAICNLIAVEELGAKHTMEFVATDNVPSRAMLESCGLRQVEGKSVVMFSTSDERLTR
ncbi:GNAT family N-acetyltransferase [Shimia aestuarii]|uniref:Acetyltransferase (GNAT) family protein n=1 Tax=Shimia aestuarii TaxID=254406 RepID=A0A1I4I8H7_9RHOB|nr:GNAT family N-acetyltransferase [Shimia aestuarii]SFL50377.1 Acetyltransferase (GNAT) family protein [Shimia aestuarii]